MSRRRREEVVVVGAGFVGLTTAIVLDRLGFPVTLVEASQERIDVLSVGEVPFYEPGVSEAWADASTRVGVVPAGSGAALRYYQRAWATFVCVGTPPLPEGGQDLGALYAVVDEWLASQRVETSTWGFLAIRSTVLPQVPTDVWIRCDASRKLYTDPWHRVVHVPEFLAEGTALRDALDPVRAVAGWVHRTEVPLSEREEFLRDITPGDPPLVHTDAATASLVKYGSNVMLASRLSTLQDLARVASRVGADVRAVSAALAQDPRIGSRFLAAGAGWGGSCFPKDVSALRSLGENLYESLPALDGTLRSNEEAIDWLADRVATAARRTSERRPGERVRVAWLGLAFKAGTSDTRESPSLAALRSCLSELTEDVPLAEVVVHDPKASAPDVRVVEAGSWADAVRGADVVVLGTAWPDYAEALAPILVAARDRVVIVDGRNLWDPRPMDLPAGAEFYGFGRPKVTPG